MTWNYREIIAANTARAEAEAERAIAEGRSIFSQATAPIDDDTPLYVTEKGLRLLASKFTC